VRALNCGFTTIDSSAVYGNIITHFVRLNNINNSPTDSYECFDFRRD
jgi:hypothetical protein